MSFQERASDAIRASGGRMTRQRSIIIDLLATASHRLDAESLYEQARQSDDSIHLATVYRTLDTLEAAGLVRQQYISTQHERKYVTLTAEPFHVTCRRCGRVFAFRSSLIDELRHQVETELNMLTFHACVCVDGLCAECSAQEETSE